MAKKGKDVRSNIRMVATEGNTGFFYTTQKNRRNTTAKLELKKYHPGLRKHVVFKEGKL
jgi:large subunit ribosomal protein L33